MGKIEQAKMAYQDIEIPKELHEMVDRTVERSRIVHQYHKKKSGKNGLRRGGLSAAAAEAVIFVADLNTSSTFAAAAGQIPVIGNIAAVLTFRDYEYADADKTVYEKIPGVTIEEANVAETAFTDEVNVKIQQACDTYLAGAIRRVEEYKEAFIATGGTEEEFAEKKIVISVDYEVKNQTEDTLSFVVKGTENWASAYAMTAFYNLDLENLSYLTLKDVLEPNYVEIANASIREQMRAREEADGSVIFWTEEEGGFTTVDEHTHFYIDSEGRPVIVFDKYEVGPGSLGMVEFAIGVKAE